MINPDVLILGTLGVLVLVFFGLLWLISQSIKAILGGFEKIVEFSMSALSQAMQTMTKSVLQPAQPPVAPLPPPVIVPTPFVIPPTPPVPPPTPTPAPSPTPAPQQQAFPGAPAWFNWAVHEIGTKEEKDNTGPAIARYISLAHVGAQGDPWCAIFANAALESCGITGTKSASSQSFRTNPNFVQLSAPALGAIAVFWRGSKSSGLGHVGFYRGELGSQVWVLGGNEDDMVQIEALPKDSASFGLVGYWWPKSVPLPTSGPVMMPQGAPTHVTTAPTIQPAEVGNTAQTFSDIIATMFGGAADAEHSAYDGRLIDETEFGVALPFHFTGARPKVKVTNPTTGASAVGDIRDVGPWYPNQGKGQPADPYWTTNTRPRAESDTATNHAGIDLTPAMAKAVGINGKGKVNWSFVTETAAAPKVT